jgi:SAM-dependent methyltransferase
MADPGFAGIDYFNRHHRLHWLKERIALGARKRMYARVLDIARPTPDTTVVDVGTTPDLSIPYNNFFERWYPHRDRLTMCSTEDCAHLEAAFPGTRFERLEGARLPFPDQRFDVAVSFAVLEHVGGLRNQAEHLRELARVARLVIVYVPYRFSPVEAHTLLPLTHWLPTRVYRGLWRLFGLAFWADERNLNLLRIRDLKRMLPAGGRARIRLLWTLGCPTNIELVWQAE